MYFKIIILFHGNAENTEYWYVRTFKIENNTYVYK